MEIRTSQDRHSSKWTLLSFNYILAGVHWMLADTYSTSVPLGTVRNTGVAVCYVACTYTEYVVSYMIHTR